MNLVKRFPLFLVLLALLIPALLPALAQDPPPAIIVTASEPASTLFGQAVQLTVFGQNFTENTTVRLAGFGLLTTTFVNSSALTAAVPTSVPVGVYTIEVSDPERGSATSPTSLTVQAIPPTQGPPPTARPTQEPLPTLAPPTPAPGEPSLVIRSFSASPPITRPGGTVILSLEIINQGNRTAQAVTVEVGSGGKFVAASGQGTVLLPDIVPGDIAVTNLAVVASSDAADGVNPVAIKFSYRDFLGNDYTRDSSITVDVERSVELSQVTITNYSTDPAPGEPGEPLTLTLELTNSGNRNATQVLVRVRTASDSVLLPGAQGDSFPIGDLPPGATATLELPMILNPTAKVGPQLQSLTIVYLENDEAKEVATGVTIDVGEVSSAPLFLLETYSTDPETLRSGDRFELSLVIVNAGSTTADDVTLTYGSGSATSPQPTPDATAQPTPPPAAGGALFAPTDAGVIQYLGRIDGGGGRIELTQNFIVSGTIESGIYDFPITLRYSKPDASTATETLRASLVVINPPRLRITLADPLPEPLPVGEAVPVALRIINIGRHDVALTLSQLSAENAEVIDGEETFVGTLRPGEDRILDASILAQADGEIVLTYSLSYVDDFNQDQVITETFSAQAAVVELPDDISFEPLPDATPPPPERDWLARLVLALMGLGS